MMADDKWAQAMAEAESAGTRDANLWARCFAEAGGDDAKAKAAYVNSKMGVVPPPPQAQQPTQTQPVIHVVKSAKSRGIYIILALLLGMLGIHNFYAGRFARGFWQLAVIVLAGWIGFGFVINFFWVLIDMITVKTDGAGDAFA